LPIEGTGAVTRKADHLKVPEHSSGSPTITCPPDAIVLKGTEFYVLPQLDRIILEILAV
jgi:hypothetical protein